MHSLKQIQGRGHLPGGRRGGGARSAAGWVLLQQQLHQLPVLLQQTGQVAVQRRFLLLQARFQVLTQGVNPGQAPGPLPLGADQRGGEAGLAEAGDGPLGLPLVALQAAPGDLQAVQAQEQLRLLGVVRRGERRIAAGPFQPLGFLCRGFSHG